MSSSVLPLSSQNPTPNHAISSLESRFQSDADASDVEISTSTNSHLVMSVASPNAILARGVFPAAEFLVRDLRESDCRDLEWHGGADLRAWYQEQWLAHRDGKVRVLVADFNGFAIGQAAIHWHGKPTHPRVPDIQSLRVFGAFRGLGVGSLLLDGAEEVARAHGFSQISLAVALENPRARALYERRGYQNLGEEYDDQWHYTDARGESCHISERVLDMVKELSV